ncbi:MAG TPA: hypothetical protein PKW79_02840 [Rhabdochlamydiaceae bacterium]|nr:hypothetical protein [Rhabdochlamydiaceae bacterium]
MKFGKLVVIKRVENIGKQSGWLCQCVCGKKKVVRYHSLKSGVTKSCGCLRSFIHSERMKRKALKHGMSGTPTYESWRAMKRRVLNKNNNSYDRYGGRGIGICAEWLHSFETFYSDMGKRPDGMTLDRIDNGNGYSKDNCRWATASEQQRNKRQYTWGHGHSQESKLKMKEAQILRHKREKTNVSSNVGSNFR